MSGETLRDFLRFDAARQRAGALSLRARPEIARNSAVSAALRAPAADAIAEGAMQLLDSPLMDVVCEAWGKLEELRKLSDPNAHPPEKINEVSLHAHEIALKREPALELMLSGAPTGLTFECELKIALKIESAILRVQNARIVGAQIGKARGGGSFKCVEVTLAERKTEALRFPGTLTFTPGYALR
jgi:hypothetical protein